MEASTRRWCSNGRLRTPCSIRSCPRRCSSETTDPRWRTAEGLEVVGPRYFGYDVDFVPIEERRATAARRAERADRR